MLRLHFKMKSAVVGNMKSNTFFGLFCEAYKRVNGETALVEMLEQLYQKEHYIAFSNALKVNTLDFVTYREKETYHVCLDREGIGNNHLFSRVNKCLLKFDVLVDTDLELTEDLLKVMCTLNIGANKNNGSGSIESITVEENTVERDEKKVLGDFVPDENTKMLKDVEYYIRRGITNNLSQKPVVMFKAGVSYTEKVDRVGRVLKDEWTNTYINGMSVVA